MNSPFKMKPGRGNMLKTGRSIPPTLMCGSPMKQMSDDNDYTKKHQRKVNEYNAQASTEAGRKSLEKGNQTSIDPATGVATPKTATHTTKTEGNFEVEYDSAGKFVKRMQRSSMSPTGGAAVEKMKKEVERSNIIKANQSAKNTNFINLTGGKKAPRTAEEMKTMRDLDRISN